MLRLFWPGIFMKLSIFSIFIHVMSCNLDSKSDFQVLNQYVEALMIIHLFYSFFSYSKFLFLKIFNTNENYIQIFMITLVYLSY